MKVFNNYKLASKYTKNSILVIGNLDGVHKGHQRIIKSAKNIAKKNNTRVGILLFNPHPRKYFESNKKGFLLTDLDSRFKILKDQKVYYVVILGFNKNLANMLPNDFCNKILFSGIKMSHVFVGTNFRFGRKRIGDYKFLHSFGKKKGFIVNPIKLIKTPSAISKNTKIKIFSSSNIRKLISKGDIKNANKFLGRPWSISSKVIKGDQRGRTIGIPTANLLMQDYISPKYGVYAVKVEILNARFESMIYRGIANYGIRPTFDKKQPLLEVHLFNFKLNIYNSSLKVSFIDYIRREKKFSGIEALKKQVKSDISTAIKILRK